MHRSLFQNEILAELLPPLEPDGTSHLWEAFGRRFTGMSYAEADLLSSENKSFVRDLFPSGNVYASLLSEEARSVIGKVGAQTRGVEKMLRRIGFRYAKRIDPFDGGPHFVAETDEIALVRDSVRRRLAEGSPKEPHGRALLARDVPSAPYFRALSAPATVLDDDVIVAPHAAERLGVATGEDLWVLPLRAGTTRPSE
jgi:arginine N-succinyltransferase